MHETLSKIFGKYAGLEIETEFRDVDVKGKIFNIPQLKNDPDPVLSAIEEEAEKHKLRLKIWFPGTESDSEQINDRLNIFIEEPVRGQWKIGSYMFLG